MKKNIILTLLLSTCLVFAGCGGKNSEPTPQAAATDVAPPAEEENSSEEEAKKAEEEAKKAEEEAKKAEEEAKKNALKDFVDSGELDESLAEINEQLTESGLTCSFDAFDTTLVLQYTFIEQLDLSGADPDALNAAFEESLVPILSEQSSIIADEISEASGVKVTAVKVDILNSDSTEIYTITQDIQ